MKVGIITQHRVSNFGSALQAYALQQVLFNNGIDNKIIDYRYPNKAHKSKKYSRTLRKSLSRILKVLTRREDYYRERSEIKRFSKDCLVVTDREFISPEDLCRNCPEFDVYMTGSDQVWNTDYLKGDTSFFLTFAPKRAKKVSYASSFGRFTFKGDKARHWLSNLYPYYAISVRETKAADIIRKYTGIEANVVLDPTLLLSREKWLELAGIKKLEKKKYILVYLLSYAWDPFPFAETVLRHYEEALGYQIKVIEPRNLASTHPEWEYIKDISPREFIRLIAEASLVITTSFHGVCFSINLQTQFVPIVNDNRVNDDRIQSLLKQVGLENIGVSEGSGVLALPEIDYKEATDRLTNLRKDSLDFLLSSLKD